MSVPTVLSDRYRLEERLAIGGMGEVWRAMDVALGRPVAVKVLKAEHVSDERFRARFRAEARFAASLQHSGIAQVYDFGEYGTLAYLVMELVPGEPLSKLVRDGGPLPAGDTLDIVAQAARALALAHASGIVHRDIKSANLLVTHDGQVKITDFGIARAFGGAGMTQTGMVMGTAQYLSPEQATGRGATPASDLYSLGVVAYECLAGRLPFAATTAVGLALKHVNEEPPRLPADVPRKVRALVSELLAKNPADRPGGGRVLADRACAIRDSLAPAGRTGPAATAGIAWRELRGTSVALRSSPAVLLVVRAGRLVFAAACTAAGLVMSLFTVRMLWKGSRRVKLMDGNRVKSAGGAQQKGRHRKTTRDGPEDRPVAPVNPGNSLSASHGSHATPGPAAKSTRKKRPPQPTPTRPAADPAAERPGPGRPEHRSGWLGSGKV